MWLDETISDDELFIPGYCLVRRDRNIHGGGVAVFIHDSIPFSVTLSHQSIELLVLDLKFKRQGLVCALFYRPPSSNQSVLVDLESSLDNLSHFKTKSLLLLGDFNIDISNHQHHACLDSIQSKHDLKQVIATTPSVHIKAPIKHPQHSAPSC